MVREKCDLLLGTGWGNGILCIILERHQTRAGQTHGGQEDKVSNKDTT